MLVVDAVITFTAWLPRSISLVYAELNNDKDYKLSCRYDKLVNSNADNFKFMIASFEHLSLVPGQLVNSVPC